MKQATVLPLISLSCFSDVSVLGCLNKLVLSFRLSSAAIVEKFKHFKFHTALATTENINIIM